MDNEAVALAAAAGDPRTGLRAVAALRKLTDQLERTGTSFECVRSTGTVSGQLVHDSGSQDNWRKTAECPVSPNLV